MNDRLAFEDADTSGRTIARNTAFNLLGRGLPLFVGLGTMPFVVRGLGEERFGFLSIGLAVIASLFMFDLGLGRAVAKFSAAYRGSHREQDIPPLLWTAVLMQSVLGIASGLLLAAITPWLVTSALSIPDDLAAEAAVCFYFLAASAVVALTEFSFAGILEAYQRFGTLNAVRAPLNIVSLLFILWVAQVDAPLPLFFAFFLVTRVFITGLLLFFCCRTVPGLLQNGRPSRASFDVLLHFGKWVTVSNLVAPILLYADRFLLGKLGTLVAVANYAAPSQVVERLLIIPGTLTSTLMPAVSALESRDAVKEIRHIAVEAMHYLVCVIGLSCVALAAAAPWVVWIFLGEAYLGDSLIVFRVLLPGIALNSVAFVPFAVVQACGRPDITAKLHLVEVPVHILMLYVGYTVAGLPGVAFAWSFRVGLDCALLLWVCVRKGWVSFGDIIARGTPQCALLFLGCGALLSQLSWGATPLQIGLATVGLAVAVIYTLFVALRAADRRAILNTVRRRTQRML